MVVAYLGIEGTLALRRLEPIRFHTVTYVHSLYHTHYLAITQWLPVAMGGAKRLLCKVQAMRILHYRP